MDGTGVLLTGLLGVLILYFFLRKPGKLPPAIPGLQPSDPVRGNLAEIAAAGTMSAFHERYHAKFGGIFSFWLKDRLVVSMSHPDYIKDIAHLDCRSRVVYKFLEAAIGKESGLLAFADEWNQRKKRYVDPAFGYRAIQQYEHEILSIFFDQTFPAWRAAAGQPQDLKKICHSLSIKIITQVAFGNMLSDPNMIDQVLFCYDSIVDYVYSDLLGKTTPGGVEDFRAKLGGMKQLVGGMVEARVKSGVSQSYRFIDLLLKEQNQELIGAEMITFFIGGFHTTGYLMAWILFYLAKHPAEQDRVRAAIDAHIPKSQKQISSKDLPADKFKVLYNFVEESLRLGQIAPFTARVSEDADVKLHDGRVIPRGTPIMEALTLLLTNTGVWPDAMEFFPDRFNSEANPAAYMPFGGSGKRICPGKTLAYTEMYTFLANVLRNFTVSFPPGFDSRVERVSTMVTVMKTDPPIVFTPRD